MNCDHCDKPAVVHEVVIKHGEKKEIHLCEYHAKMAGVDVPGQQPINKVLSNFVMSQGSEGSASGGTAKRRKTCSTCGMSFARFRQEGTLGCADCYETFDEQLGPLIERTQSGATHHVGKVPARAGGTIDRQRVIQQLVKELDEAVAAEQYERAAQLRDRLVTLESNRSGPEATSSSALTADHTEAMDQRSGEADDGAERS